MELGEYKLGELAHYSLNMAQTHTHTHTHTHSKAHAQIQNLNSSLLRIPNLVFIILMVKSVKHQKMRQYHSHRNIHIYL